MTTAQTVEDLTKGGTVAWIPQPDTRQELEAMADAGCPWCCAKVKRRMTEWMRFLCAKPRPEGKAFSAISAADSIYRKALPVSGSGSWLEPVGEGECSRVTGDLLRVCYDLIVEKYGDRSEDSIRAALASGLLDSLLREIREAA